MITVCPYRLRLFALALGLPALPLQFARAYIRLVYIPVGQRRRGIDCSFHRFYPEDIAIGLERQVYEWRLFKFLGIQTAIDLIEIKIVGVQPPIWLGLVLD